MESLKEVIFGSACMISGVLLTTLPLLVESEGGLVSIFPFIGMGLTILGFYCGFRGMIEENTDAEKKSDTRHDGQQDSE